MHKFFAEASPLILMTCCKKLIKLGAERIFPGIRIIIIIISGVFRGGGLGAMGVPVMHKCLRIVRKIESCPPSRLEFVQKI